MTPKTEQGLLIPIPSSWLAVESGVKVLCVFKGRNSCTVDCQGVWLFYGTWNCNFQSSDTSDQECRFWRTLAIHLSYVVAVSEDSAKIRLHVQQYGCVPPPIFIVTISLLQVALFVHYLIESNEPLTWMTSCAGCFVRNNRESSMIFDSGFANEIWRFGSYFLIHQGQAAANFQPKLVGAYTDNGTVIFSCSLQHLLFNLITQIALVCPLEIVHKMWRIGPLYFSGVIYSSLLHFLIDRDVVLIGASGGAYAVVGAYVGNLISGFERVMSQKAKLGLIMLFTIVDFGHASYRRHYLNQCLQKSYVAHLGGWIAGLLLHGIGLRQFVRPHSNKIVRIILPCIYFTSSLVLVIVASTVGSGGSTRNLLTSCNVTFLSI